MTLAQQLACVEREIKMRESLFPIWVEIKTWSQHRADHELACMRAVAETLRGLMKGEGL